MRSAWVPIAQTIGVSASPRPAATPRTADRVSARTRSTVIAGTRRRRACAESRFIRKRRLAERREDDGREPAEQDVGREAGRVGRAQQRRDRLELGGVPEADAGQQRQPRGATNATTPTTSGGARAVEAVPRHHPRSRPQTTPQALIATDDDDRGRSRERHRPGPRRRRSTARRCPSATSTSANGTKSLLNR